MPSPWDSSGRGPTSKPGPETPGDSDDTGPAAGVLRQPGLRASTGLRHPTSLMPLVRRDEEDLPRRIDLHSHDIRRARDDEDQALLEPPPMAAGRPGRPDNRGGAAGLIVAGLGVSAHSPGRGRSGSPPPPGGGPHS